MTVAQGDPKVSPGNRFPPHPQEPSARRVIEAGGSGPETSLWKNPDTPLSCVEHGSLTIGACEALCPDINRRSLQRDLKGMLDKGVLVTEGATNRLEYRLRG